MLELSRLCGRLLPLERHAVDMEKIVVRALDELRPQVEANGQVAGRATSGGGSGLELSIVKGRVETHGGRIRVESEEGRGSRFLVRLPRDGALPVGASQKGSER
jgi:signal transduction histidine kinase